MIRTCWRKNLLKEQGNNGAFDGLEPLYVRRFRTNECCRFIPPPPQFWRIIEEMVWCTVYLVWLSIYQTMLI